MPSNVTANAGSGGDSFCAAQISFDDDTVKLPGNFLGILSGSEDAYTFTAYVGGAGAVGAGVQRMTLANDDPAVAALGSIKTAVELIDDTVGTLDAASTAKAVMIGVVEDANIVAPTAISSATLLDNVSFAGGHHMLIASLNFMFDGSAWDRVRGTSADGLLVNLGTNNDIVGAAAHGAAVSGNPVLVGLEGRSSDQTAVDSGDVTRVLASLLGKQVQLPFSLPANTWSYTTANGGVTDTADDEAKAAGAAGVRHYITGAQVVNGHGTTSTEVVVKDGATVLWRGWAQAAGGGCAATFNPPLRGTAATAVNVANVTNASQTYISVQGYSALE